MTEELLLKHISFPSIDQFRTVIMTVNQRCALKQITDKPTLTFAGTVKLHGTNASVVYNGINMYAQTRDTILSLEKDNAGFARWVGENTLWQETLEGILTAYQTTGFIGSADYEAERPHAKEAHTVAVYGEWCGGSIQKGVALNKLPKMFVVFGIKFLHAGMVKENGEMVPGQIGTWLMPWDLAVATDMLKGVGIPLHCIEDFPTWLIDIDFNEPVQSQNRLGELTLAIEQECPVGKHFGVSGVGEGIVWTCIGMKDPADIALHDLTFKVKGEKHSDTKATKLAAVDIVKVNSINACAELVGTPHRFEKAIAHVELLGVDDVYAMKNIGPFLKWIGLDIEKEETDTIIGNGLEVKDVTKAVQGLAKTWFVEQSKL